jgi:dolichol kinase
MSTEAKRKLSHWCILIVPACYFFLFSKNLTLGILGIVILIVSVFEIIRLKNDKLNRALLAAFKGIYRPEEMNRTSTLIYTLSGMFFTIFLFPKTIAILAILFLTFGDGFAALVGEKWGKHRLYQGTKKTWEGSIANLFTCLIVGIIFSIFFPEISLRQVLPGAVAVALIEALPLSKDNILIPVFAALIMTFTGQNP